MNKMVPRQTTESNKLQIVNDSSCRQSKLYLGGLITVWIRLFQSEDTHTKLNYQDSNSQTSARHSCNGYFLSPIIELSLREPNKLWLHPSQSYPCEFSFEKIFCSPATNPDIAAHIDLFDDLAVRRRNHCVLVIGAQHSGIDDLCQGKRDKESLFFKAYAKIIDRIKQSQVTSETQLVLTFTVLVGDRFVDLVNPVLPVEYSKDSKELRIKATEEAFTNKYDLFVRLREIFAERDHRYPGCILIMQGSIANHRFKLQSSQKMISVSVLLIDWRVQQPRNGEIKSEISTVKAMFLNICARKLGKQLKGSGVQEQTQRLNNCVMNNLLESYLIPSTQNHGLTMIGCIAVNACYEKETYDTLTICNAVYKLTKTFFIGDYNQKTTEKQPVTKRIIRRAVQGQSVALKSTSENSPLKKVNGKSVKQRLNTILNERNERREKNDAAIRELACEHLSVCQQLEEVKRRLQILQLKKQRKRIVFLFEQSNKVDRSKSHLPIIQHKQEKEQNPEVLLRVEAERAQIQFELDQLRKRKEQLQRDADTKHEIILRELQKKLLNGDANSVASIYQREAREQDILIQEFIINKSTIRRVMEQQANQWQRSALSKVHPRTLSKLQDGISSNERDATSMTEERSHSMKVKKEVKFGQSNKQLVISLNQSKASQSTKSVAHDFLHDPELSMPKEGQVSSAQYSINQSSKLYTKQVSPESQIQYSLKQQEKYSRLETSLNLWCNQMPAQLRRRKQTCDIVSKRRQTLLKEKIKRGRVQLQRFLDETSQKYQEYSQRYADSGDRVRRHYVCNAGG